jgi:integrase
MHAIRKESTKWTCTLLGKKWLSFISSPTASLAINHAFPLVPTFNQPLHVVHAADNSPVDRVREAAGLDETFTPHVLRHTFASLAAQAGVSLYKIGTWMGHTMSEVTEIYAHLAQFDPDINRLNLGGRK